MITADQLIEIGRYNKAHGINGEISATFDCDTMAVGELSALVSPMDGIFVPFFVNGIRPKNNDTLLLKIDGISNETQAKRLVNCPIYALAEEMPELVILDINLPDGDGFSLFPSARSFSAESLMHSASRLMDWVILMQTITVCLNSLLRLLLTESRYQSLWKPVFLLSTLCSPSAEDRESLL